jgi:hypothetical protein
MQMRKKGEPPRPEEKTYSLSFRHVTTKHADAAAYKGHVVITMPSDREWMVPRDARRFAESILAAVALQEDIDAWDAKYDSQSYEGRQARRRRGR